MHTCTRGTRRAQVYVIDVSQSVDLDHPKALDFLREDCQHVNDFFKRAGVATLTVRELFDLVTDPLVTDANRDEVLETLQQVHCHPASPREPLPLLCGRAREPCGLVRCGCCNGLRLLLARCQRSAIMCIVFGQKGTPSQAPGACAARGVAAAGTHGGGRS